VREWIRIAEKSERIAVGLMSGTSADGVDAALVQLAGSGSGTKVETLAFVTVPFEDVLRRRVLDVASARVDEVSSLHVAIGEASAAAVRQVADAANVPLDRIDFIASHGQTIFHDPGGEPPSTFQIGDAAVIAERTGIPVIFDFRARDVAAGGSGAPLIPYVDHLLFADAERTRILINLGGIVNLTIVPPGAALDDVIAFDVGPCNMLLDGLAEILLDTSYDKDGEVSLAGKPFPGLVEDVMRHPYFAERPPKSTGRELFGERFVASCLAAARRRGLTMENTLASVADVVSASVAQALETLVPPRYRRPDDLILSGGGVHNRAIWRGFEERFPGASIATSREFGLDPDAKEAVAFAMLGNETIDGRPSNVPGVTGASHPVVLGSFAPGRSRE
jgi:anhydro-N-acetylmuramic acid kinase